MPSKRSLRRALGQAATYADWLAAAEALDEATGLEAWRADDASPHVHSEMLREHMEAMTVLRHGGDARALGALLHTSLHRHLGDLTSPELYSQALSGTKHLVDQYLREVEQGVDFLAATKFPELAEAEKRKGFELALRNLGRSALLLSGGASLGFYHLGVIKALWEQDLLPHVMSGASIGAMIAAGICCRNDDEIGEYFADPSTIRLQGLGLAKIGEMWSNKALLDPERMAEILRHNIGPMTFKEAWQRSGRSLSISVSPTRKRQKPRILNHLTAPDVLVWSAALASSAIPALFPPVTLMARDRSGVEAPYIPSERWVDGSLHGDLPTLRLSRLFNVNHFIVSQTNPHVLPLLSLEEHGGVVARATNLAARAARAQVVPWVTAARDLTRRLPGAQWTELTHAVLTQPYRGDIGVHPRFDLRLWLKVRGNASEADLQRFILEGERGTWPKISEIRNQTRVRRALARAL